MTGSRHSPAGERHVIVTGGSRGIGRAVVLRLIESGWQAINLDRQPPEQVVPRERFCRVDLSDRQALQVVLDQVVKDAAVIGLVNNVGIGHDTPVGELSIEQLELMSQVNLWCPIQCMQAVLPAMRERRWGRVVNISSRAALGKSGRSLYSATKAGLHGLTRTWALEFAAKGITVNTVSPGPIATDMFYQHNPPDSERTAAIIGAVPVQRMGAPDEVAHAVAYFTDEAAGFTTGQLLHVCGGLTVGAG